MKCILIEIFEREMISFILPLEEAKKLMASRYQSIIEQSFIEACEFDEMSAWANTSKGNFDWEIIELE